MFWSFVRLSDISHLTAAEFRIVTVWVKGKGHPRTGHEGPEGE